MRRLWITWEDQPRNRSMARTLKAELLELNSKKSRLIKFPFFIMKTTLKLIACRPHVLFVQNPSIVLSFLAVILKPIFRYRLCVDEHNAGLFPLESRYRVLNAHARWIARRADLVLVTNKYLADIVISWGANPAIMPDPIPELGRYLSESVSSDGSCFKLFFVCTWAADEPYLDVIKAVGSLKDALQLKLVISGKYQGKIDSSVIPENVHLTGYLDRHDYYREFASADASIVLTNRDNCLNCGAYESVALEKPGLLANTQALSEYFGDGFIYTDLDQESIKRSIIALIENVEVLSATVKKTRTSLVGDSLQAEERIMNKLSV